MMDSVGGWNPQDTTLSASSQDDFQQFLDMGMANLDDNLQFDFDFNQQQAQSSQMMHADGTGPMNARIGNGHALAHSGTMQENMLSMTTTSTHPAILGTAMAHGQRHAESLSDLDAQIQYLQQQRHQQQQRQLQGHQKNYFMHNGMIPPTPNSLDLQGANQQHFYSQAEQQSVYEPYRLAKDQELAFTPLASPAVTPLEAHFNIPEYTIPGAYFSPLSSPALHAQNEHQAIFDRGYSGTTNSPIETNVDSHSAPASSIIPSRNHGNRKPGPKPRGNPRAVRQSPIVKPRRGKKSLSTSMSAQALGEILEPSSSQCSRSKETGSSNSAASTDHSENGSISPEHLSGMAPPPLPLPNSTGRSPHVAAQKGNAATTARFPLGSPATPASLMRLTQSPTGAQVNTSQDMDLDDPSLGTFALPEPATSINTVKPSLARIDTQSDGQMTPTLSATGSKTPGFQSLPSPAFARPAAPASASQSPQIDSMNGANRPVRKTPQIAARGTKKRPSTSVLASPALLPKISPSIKPLLPGGGVSSEDTAASLLLASKSNYQNILEGTHLPGVSYPSELSTNLTSKRTSHKIAEQGRRNRINSALQEMATLIPRGPAKESGDKSGSGDAGENESSNRGGQSASSKASTVEQAIDYIKHLKTALSAAEARAEAAERQLQEKSA